MVSGYSCHNQVKLGVVAQSRGKLSKDSKFLVHNLINMFLNLISVYILILSTTMKTFEDSFHLNCQG